MRVSVTGYHRDHGSRTLVEKDLSEIAVAKDAYCPYDKTIVYMPTDQLGESYISIITRINTALQGNYKLEIRFTLSDILSLFWTAFKDRALQVVFPNRARLTSAETSSV